MQAAVRAIQRWSIGKLIVICLAWFVLSNFALVALSLVWVTWAMDVGAGSGGIGAVSAGFAPGLFVLISVLPPLVFAAIWIAGKASTRK